MRTLVLILLLGAPCAAATHEVAQSGTIQAALDKAQSGDTIVIRAGVYRESVRVNKSVVITGAAGEDVVISGADVIPSSQWTQLPDKPIWQHTPWTYRGPTHPNDNFHQLIGRTEQTIVDGKLLTQVLELSQLAAGTFYADPAKALYVWLPGGDAPSAHRIEASVRPVLMDITADHVIVRNLRLIYASNRAQQGALKIDGSENVVEDCITEWTNGVGTRLAGNQNILRRVVSRFNGQLGLSGAGMRNLMEDCKLEGNNVKGFSKDWEAGGMKAANTRNFQVQHCSAIRNDGPGFWFDIDNRDELVEGSYTEANNGPGIFIEISETATVRNNLCVRNGSKEKTRGSWNQAGILLGEAMRCIVEHNICVGNRNGIEVRQQGIRAVKDKRYYSDGLVFRNNILAFNSEWQFAFYGDNAFFGAKPQHAKEPPSQQDLELFDPANRDWRSSNNLYYNRPGEGLILWGAKWQPKHQEFDNLKTFEAQHHLEQGSLVADPLFVKWEAGDFNLNSKSPARSIAAGFKK